MITTLSYNLDHLLENKDITVSAFWLFVKQTNTETTNLSIEMTDSSFLLYLLIKIRYNLYIIKHFI